MSQSPKNTENSGNRESLNNSPMMVHLMQSLEKGTDIGHYGKLTFVMVARHFMSEDEMVSLLVKAPDTSEISAKTLIKQVNDHNYNPPKRERILEWQGKQDFPICPTSDDPDSCNVYQELQFPDGLYTNIQEYHEEQVEAEEKKS